MERILIGDRSEIFVGRERPAPLLPPRAGRRRVVVFTQPGAAGVAREISAALADLDATLHVMPDREEAKTLAAVESAYARMAELGMARDDTVVAVGGGALTDAAGFVAGTWMRGIEAVYVPTTLLGAVDAAVGGKTGVNIGGKNLVGLFWHPRRVVVDLDVLDRLPPALKREGAAEVIKAGLLARPDIVDAYRRHGLDVSLDHVVPAAVAIKAEVVAGDFTEKGRRGLLNLGHTIGHAIEFASDLSHGEAVAIGLVAAAAVSERLLGFAATSQLIEALRAVDLPVASPPLDREEILRLIGLDKKRSAGRTRMALLEAPGKPFLREVTDEDVAWGLEAVGL